MFSEGFDLLSPFLLSNSNFSSNSRWVPVAILSFQNLIQSRESHFFTKQNKPQIFFQCEISWRIKNRLNTCHKGYWENLRWPPGAILKINNSQDQLISRPGTKTAYVFRRIRPSESISAIKFKF